MKTSTLGQFGVRNLGERKRVAKEPPKPRHKGRRREAVYCMEGRHWAYYLVGGKMCRRCLERKQKTGV
jgi:hypothetical protein